MWHEGRDVQVSTVPICERGGGFRRKKRGGLPYFASKLFFFFLCELTVSVSICNKEQGEPDVYCMGVGKFIRYCNNKKLG